MEKVDYLVIGGGMAGLTAAYELQKAGKQVLVLESEPIPGGRASSQNFAGIYINQGADFILSSYTNTLMLVEELGLTLIPRQKINSILIHSDPNITISKSNPFSIFKVPGATLFNLIKLWVNLFRNHENISVAEFIERSTGSEKLRKSFDLISQDLFFYDTDRFSFRLFKSLLSYTGRAKYFTFLNGIGELGTALAKSVDIRFGCKVIRLKRVNSYVEVTFVDDSGNLHNIVSPHTILAVPGNRVTQLVEDLPPSAEKLFTHLRYSAHLNLFCKSEISPFAKGDLILFPSESPFTSINFISKSGSEFYFNIGVKSNLSAQWNNSDLQEIISKHFPDLEPQIVGSKYWEAAIPIFDPEHMQNLEDLVTDSSLQFVGDYLVGPFIEGAVTSGKQAVKKLLDK